jgi:hypothetical protein
MQKASGHQVHSKSLKSDAEGTEDAEDAEKFLKISLSVCSSGLYARLLQKFTGFSSLRPLRSQRALRNSSIFGSRMDLAPTHCMQSVSGSISLP